MQKSAFSMFITLSLFGSTQAYAQAAVVDGEPATDIVVTGITDPYVLSEKQLSGARAEFARWQPSLAPSALLSFRVGTFGGATYNGLVLTLRSGTMDIPIPLDERHRFILPDLGSAKAILFANRRKHQIIIEPIILSSGTSEANRRLGDLRLQCRVSWGLERSQTSLAAQALYSATGGCAGRRVPYNVLTSWPITKAELVVNSTRAPLKIFRERMFVTPIADKKRPDDAMVILTLK
jgi:hypothetical protein